MCTNITTINPQSLLTPAELAALEAAQETITNPPTFPPSAVPDWERQLLEPEFVARIEAEAAASWSAADTVEQARHTVEGITALVEERRELIARLREDVDHVDLDHVQDTLMPGVTVSRAGGPIQWVETLLAVTGQEESGPLRRLLAGVQSATSRRDGNVTWKVKYFPHTSWGGSPIGVTARSDAGAFSARRWELQTTLVVREDQYGEVRITTAPVEHRLTVWSRARGGHTLYTGHVIAQMSIRWVTAYLGRQGIRDLIVPALPVDEDHSARTRRLGAEADLAALDIVETTLRTRDGHARPSDIARAIRDTDPDTPLSETHMHLALALARLATNAISLIAHNSGQTEDQFLALLREHTQHDAATRLADPGGPPR